MTSPEERRTYTARWVFPVSGPPLARGTVTVADGRLVAVAAHGEQLADEDLGEAALLPGFVNPHTHLDLSGLRGRISPVPSPPLGERGRAKPQAAEEDTSSPSPLGSFTDWLRAVIALRRSQSPGEVREAIRAGVEESLAHGVTLVGDISAGGVSWEILATSPLRAIVFHELLGLPREQAGRAWADALAWLRAHPATPTCRPGLSPHAPYSVRASLFAAVARLAAARGLPLTTHLAETEEELALLHGRSGPFVDFLQEVGVWDPAGLVADIAGVLEINAPVPHVLYVHGNYLDPELPPSPEGAVIYCPRTHAHFGHPPHPYREMQRRGHRVALGTDSLASNPDLSVLEEARFLHARDPALPGATLLHMITAAGADVLGWGDETGTLEEGKSADLAVLPLPDREESDPHFLLFHSDLPVRAVMIQGRWVRSLPQRRNGATEDQEREERE